MDFYFSRSYCLNGTFSAEANSQTRPRGQAHYILAADSITYFGVSPITLRDVFVTGVKEQKVGGKIPRVHFTLRTVIIKYLIFIGNFGHATHCAENFSHHLI